jgi:hypothetical protein
MDLRRVRVWEWLTGAAGLVLLVSLFLPWYGLDNVKVGGAIPFDPTTTATGWESFSVVDVLLALAALGAMALPVVAAMQRTAAVPQSLTALLMFFAVVAAVAAVVRLLNPPDVVTVLRAAGAEGGYSSGDRIDVMREVGVWLGALSALAIFFCDYRSMGDSRTPHAMRSRLDVATVPAPTPDGERRDLTA